MARTLINRRHSICQATGHDGARTEFSPGVASAELLSGKEMSFKHYAMRMRRGSSCATSMNLRCAIIKHTNPAGMALGSTTEEAIARRCVRSGLGVLAHRRFNRPIDEAACAGRH